MTASQQKAPSKSLSSWMTTVVGLLSNDDETIYRSKADSLIAWCAHHNLELNIARMVEMLVEFCKHPSTCQYLKIEGSAVSKVESFRFLGTTITNQLKWDNNITILLKKACQRLVFLQQLRKLNVHQLVLIRFYPAIKELVLTTSITVWFPSASSSCKARMQRVVHSAEMNIRCKLTKIKDLYTIRAKRR